MTENSMHPTPTEHHQKLQPFAGTFKSEVKIWMGNEDPMISTGTITNSFQVSDLYLHQDYVGDPNEGPFPTFVGKGYWGFNTSSSLYEGFWIDNASTIMQMETGQVDETGKVWEMHSEVNTPNGPMKKRTVITLLDNDSHRMESYFVTPEGTEAKTMEINYHRA